ncbi:polysaccharide lyase family 3 protein [Aplosporella prunicola CBS 121167]|uniref:Pectate lyase n=1 Tax=Aplosporella prunicola CBS 121167 TaxID=1176127 RepID=A0A6A6B1A8_9PEZI|nr:polysaccharide lyase family 3 protein [Aplosporella prunicola CBS 121167]KAF2137045.1 polysaccharide lyase family 3 protein [Aplosporella prunicola CBS 121167]
MFAKVFVPLLAASSIAAAATSKPRTATFGKNLVRRADFPIPDSTGNETFDEAKEIDGEFDGEYKTFGRGVSCTGQDEGGDSDAVFILKDGATLKNAIIGSDQIEGVHCEGSCTIENVWWEAVCEDALSLKGDGDATITGGGATGADDKVIQHNGAGSVTIDGFTVTEFGKLYRSCGNCDQNGDARTVTIKNVKATNGKSLVGINSNYGDTATLSDTCATSVKEICVEYEGTNDNDKEPEEVSSGPSDACIYTDPLPEC